MFVVMVAMVGEDGRGFGMMVWGKETEGGGGGRAKVWGRWGGNQYRGNGKITCERAGGERRGWRVRREGVTRGMAWKMSTGSGGFGPDGPNRLTRRGGR